ncbi:max dimerization protein 3 isoform X2 [Anolis carolinensis]|uniref:max dimerization protein 3 isoform X2 n=1 Tax=Anolis carolinensis TaxID=28377 RepID=UPI000462C01B|nr:PREDICTED: max dimerization protein 3 isoform X2 [Anolis carolinensis]|eukprot:XP_008103168.1 PREDICTED: max dimerization protein 3 isoform X2 [Anolis carolinensis]
MGGDRTLERSKGAGSSPGWLPIKAAVGRLQCRRNKVLGRIEPPMLVVMELVASNIQVLLQAAEYLERREREAEHGYASLSPHCGRDARQSRRRPKPRKAVKSLRSAHNELEKHRRAQLRHCLEQLKQQIPMNTEHSRYTTLNLLHRARLHIKKLEDQEEKARRQKERLRSEQRNLHQRLEELLAHSSVERPRADSLDSSRFSSEHSDSDAEVDVEGLAFISTEEDVVAAISTGQEHSYSNTNNVWL